MKFFKSYYKTLIVSIFFAILTSHIVLTHFSLYKVYGSSMENTLHHDDFLLVSLKSYNTSSPKRNDIVNINYIDDYLKKIIVKRIIGVPGDTLEFYNNKIYINGSLLDEPFVKDVDNLYLNYKITIPQNKYFVLGDNRDTSYDSRYFGLVDKSSIQGKVISKFCILNKSITLFN